MKHCILFTGHMIDDGERKDTRFPASKETAVRDEMLKRLVEVKASTSKLMSGIAGGACGGDIIFHELCGLLGISTEMYLPFSIEKFKKHSVSFAGTPWDVRFDRLAEKLTLHILQKQNVNAGNNVWAIANQWMLDAAYELGDGDVTLIALWDQKDGDGVGGTEHMVDAARAKGAKINIIDITKI